MPIIGPNVDERALHRIEDDLSDDWLQAFISSGLADVERYLGKHADFDAYLEDRD